MSFHDLIQVKGLSKRSGRTGFLHGGQKDKQTLTNHHADRVLLPGIDVPCACNFQARYMNAHRHRFTCSDHQRLLLHPRGVSWWESLIMTSDCTCRPDLYI
jgi:hypothetical protein